MDKLNKVKLNHKGDEVFLDIPNMPDNELPSCTIVTPTYNRSLIFDIAIRNYKNYNYPRHKLFWIILDDSNDEESAKLKEKIDESFKNDNSVTYVRSHDKLTIGKKRNMLAEMVNTDIICHQDDDDYYYPDSVRIRAITLLYFKLPVCGCIEYNCYNLVDDTEFLARGTPDKMNVGEASLCYSKNFWRTNNFNDSDTHEEAIYFLQNVNKTENKNNNESKINSLYIDIPCEWILLSITHSQNTSGRKNIQDKIKVSFLDLLPVNDYNFIKNLKYTLLVNDPNNKRLLGITTKMQEHLKKNDYAKINKIVDSLKPKERKNFIIRDFLHNVPSKTNFSEKDFLILCFPGQYNKKIKFEEELELINFIKENKNKYRFTIFTDCETGENFEGITTSPYWKFRAANKYNYCIIYDEPSHFKIPMNINPDNVYYFNKTDFDVLDIKGVKSIKDFGDF